MRRVAVTGVGVLSPLGNDCDDVFNAARCGRSAVALLTGVIAERLHAPLAAVVQFDVAGHFDPAKARMLDRVSQFAIVAARCATADAGLDLTSVDADRAGVFVGAGMGGSISMDDGYRTLYGEGSDRIKPLLILMGMHNAPAAWVGIESGFRGPNLTYSTACSSSAVAIGEAWLRIASGNIDIALAGGQKRRCRWVPSRHGRPCTPSRLSIRALPRRPASRFLGIAPAWFSVKARPCWCSNPGTARSSAERTFTARFSVTGWSPTLHTSPGPASKVRRLPCKRR